MKKLVKSLPLVGFILAVGAAFAFNSANLDTAWYYLDAAGNPVTRIEGEPECNPGSQDCAQMFEEDQNQNPITPVGQPVKGAIHQ